MPYVTRVLALIIFFMAVVLTANSFRYFLAEVNAYQGKRYEKHWEKRGAISSTEQWEAASVWMQRSLGLNEHNPDNWLRYARVMEWYGFTPQPDGQVIRDKLELASQAIERAIAQRPGEGFGYSSRALLQARRWQIDGQLSEDLRKAMQLSPWERPAQRQVMHAGMSAWPELDESGRAVVFDAFSAAVKSSAPMAKEYTNIAARYGRQNILCARLGELNSKLSNGLEVRKCRIKE